MRVKDLMSTHLLTVRPDTPLADAVTLMLRHKVSGLPVVDEIGTLVGVVSEGDLLRRIELGTEDQGSTWALRLFRPEKLAETYTITHGRKVEDVMSRNPITVESTAPLRDAAQLMQKHGVKRLPVLDGSSLVGLLTRADFMRMLANLVGPSYEEPATSDNEIRERILAEITHQSWAHGGTYDVIVENGKVELVGTVVNDSQRDAARVAAENVPGVRAVVDRLTCIDPATYVAF